MTLEELFRRKGVRELYPTQKVLIDKGLVSSGNFVLAAPTASGKTLVAEMIMDAELSRGGKVLYLVPLRSLAYEKYDEFRKIFREYSVRISMGDYDSAEEPLGAHDIIVMTYEKFDSVQRHGPKWLSHVSLLILDEVHYVGDPYRGPTLEMAVSRFIHDNPEARRVALSATITNLGEVADWLDALPVRVDWRPVPLDVGIFHDGSIIYSDGRIEELRGDLIDLVKRSLIDGGQVLIFFNRRIDAVSWAERLASRLKIGGSKIPDEISSSLGPSKLADRLAAAMASGIAFHHAGLPFELRRLVETEFRAGKIRVITATPTLAAGVNLPARTVIITSHVRFDRRKGYAVPISVMEFWQMAGRAGRPGYDIRGEAILVVRDRSSLDAILEKYVTGEPEPITSHLHEMAHLRTHILALIASRLGVTEREILDIMKKTLLAKQGGLRIIDNLLPLVLSSLESAGFISISRERVRATEIGKRISELYLDPASAQILVESVDELVRRFDSGSDLVFPVLHLISMLPDMPRVSMRGTSRGRILEILEELDPLIDVDYLPVGGMSELIQVTKASLALHRWISGASDGDIELELGIEPGDVRNIAETASWLCYAYSEIVRLLDHLEPARWLKILSERLKHGVPEEMLEIVRIRGVGRVRARTLFSAGYRSLRSLAEARAEDLAKLTGIGNALARTIVEQAREIVDESTSH